MNDPEQVKAFDKWALTLKSTVQPGLDNSGIDHEWDAEKRFAEIKKRLNYILTNIGYLGKSFPFYQVIEPHLGKNVIADKAAFCQVWTSFVMFKKESETFREENKKMMDDYVGNPLNILNLMRNAQTLCYIRSLSVYIDEFLNRQHQLAKPCCVDRLGGSTEQPN